MSAVVDTNPETWTGDETMGHDDGYNGWMRITFTLGYCKHPGDEPKHIGGNETRYKQHATAADVLGFVWSISERCQKWGYRLLGVLVEGDTSGVVFSADEMQEFEDAMNVLNYPPPAGVRHWRERYGLMETVGYYSALSDAVNATLN